MHRPGYQVGEHDEHSAQWEMKGPEQIIFHSSFVHNFCVSRFFFHVPARVLYLCLDFLTLLLVPLQSQRWLRKRYHLMSMRPPR